MPTTQATTSSAATITINGGFSKLAMQSLTAGQVIYVRPDGPNAVVGADLNYAVPPFPAWTSVPCQGSGTTTVFSAISSSAASLYIRPVDNRDDF